MKLTDYINGNRHGSDAHELELDAMTDPLLADALDGFRLVAGSHTAVTERLAARIGQSALSGRVALRVRTRHLRERRIRVWSVSAATVFIASLIGSGIFLLRDDAPAGPGLETLASSAKYGESRGPAEQDAVLPPVTVIPDNSDVSAATDVSGVAFDELEIHDVGRAALSEPAADTVIIAGFRRFLAGQIPSGGVATVAFEVGEAGRPGKIVVKAASSPETGARAVKLLSEGPDWPAEPAKKLITIEL